MSNLRGIKANLGGNRVRREEGGIKIIIMGIF